MVFLMDDQYYILFFKNNESFSCVRNISLSVVSSVRIFMSKIKKQLKNHQLYYFASKSASRSGGWDLSCNKKILCLLQKIKMSYWLVAGKRKCLVCASNMKKMECSGCMSLKISFVI
mgnify:CR=1 FL=1